MVCHPVNRFLLEDILEERLTNILYYFINHSIQDDTIYNYCELWSQLNEIAELHTSQIISLLATCAAAEICRNHVQVTEKSSINNSPTNFFRLYINVAKHIAEINRESRSYVWKYRLLQTWAEGELFQIDLYPLYTVDIPPEYLFKKMFHSLMGLGSSWGISTTISEFALQGLQQLVESSAHVVDSRISLRELLMPVLTGSANVRYIVQMYIPSMIHYHCNALCTIIIQKLVLNQITNIFDGNDLIIAEKVMLLSPNINAFESLAQVITRFALNFKDRDHEHITRILCVLIIRHTDNCKNKKWEHVELDRRKQIQLMVKRFVMAMTHQKRKIYPNILLKYGSRLLDNAPTRESLFRYFKIFQHYIKKCEGEKRQTLIRIFDENLPGQS